MRVILLGPPGAGKGTQAGGLAGRLGVPHVASGDIFRAHISDGTALGRRAKEYIDQGLLVPDEVTIDMVLDRLAQPDCQRGVVLDGFPRTVEQAHALDEALRSRGEAVDAVLYVKVSAEELVGRLGGRLLCSRCETPYHPRTAPPGQPGVCDACGGELYQREDDQPEAVRQRIGVYAAQTAPLVDYYAGRGKLREVNGEQPIERVAGDLEEALAI